MGHPAMNWTEPVTEFLHLSFCYPSLSLHLFTANPCRTNSEDVWTVKFSPSAELIATGSFKGKVRLYKVSDGIKRASLDTGGKFALSHAFVSDV